MATTMKNLVLVPFAAGIRAASLALAALLCMAQSAWALSSSGGYYLIGTAQDLKDFASLVNAGNTTINGKLIAPIDLAGSELNQWTPIGTYPYPYNGTFDGQGFTISNLYYHQSVGCAGLFSRAGGSARIKNVRVVVDIDNTGNGATAAGGGTEAGGILGMGSEGTVIINCSVSGSVLSHSNVGGLVGAGSVMIINCCNEATVKFYSAVGQTGGGIHGYGGSPTLINCYNVGKIINTGSATSHMGNIAAAATATDCYSLANCCQNGAGAGWSNGAANQISGTTMTSEAMHSASFVSTLNGNAAAQRSTYSDIEDWVLHPTTSLPVHKNSITYAIEYNLNGGHASNAAYYDVTTATFTLNNPTREGYLFTGWTGSNGSTPQTVVTVSQGSTGNRAYTANWISWDEVNAYVGKVIGADGKMYKTVAAAQNAGTTASGVIAYWGWAGSAEASGSAYRGLAISLETWTAIPWCTDPVSWYAGSTLTQALDSNDGCERTTTFGRPESRNVTDIYGHIHNHQAAALVYDYSKSRPSGSSRWFVPSLGQWNLVAKALTGSSSDISEIDNPDYTYSNLSAKLTAAGASGLGWAAYWSSTEKDGTTMWIFDIGGIGGDRNGGRASTRSKQQCGEAEYLRAFFAFEDATDAVYTISYDANGGSGAPSAQTKDGGIDLTLSSTAPTRAGYTFAGWNTAADGSGTQYASGATFTGNVNTTLYAQWGGYGAWAEDNGIAGAWNETDASGIHNVFRYVFGVPGGAFANPPLIDIALEDGKVVIKTPPVANSEGVTVSVVESSDVAGETVTETKAVDAAGRTEFAKDSAATSRFYRLSAEETE